MAQELDVYRDWLGIKDPARPLNHYQLLRLPAFEDDAGKIRTHYRKMNEHVRKFATGEFSGQSQTLLNELAKAMLCLTDLQRKREYDAAMGREVEGEGLQRTFEEILLAGKVIDQAQLDKARGLSDTLGLELHKAVMQQKMAEPDAVMAAYAESIGLPFLDLTDLGADAQLSAQIPPNLARQHSFAPILAEAHLLVASPTPLVPDVEEELRLRFELPVRTVLCTPGQINEAIATFFPRDAPDPGPISSKKGKAKKGKKEKAAKPAKEQAVESDPAAVAESKKQRILFSIVGFNMGVVLAVAAQYIMASFSIEPVTPSRVIGVAVGVGILVGGITYAVLPKR